MNSYLDLSATTIKYLDRNGAVVLIPKSLAHSEYVDFLAQQALVESNTHIFNFLANSQTVPDVLKTYRNRLLGIISDPQPNTQLPALPEWR
jgi:hypothetical protein